MNPQDAELDALSRFVAGESDPTELRAMNTWLAAHPADDALARAVKNHAERAERSADAALRVDVESALRSVRARLEAETAPTLRVVAGGASKATRPAAAASTRWGRWVFAAAAATIAIVGARTWSNRSVTQSAGRVVATRVGERDSLTLSDGSKVVMAPGSRLTVADNFDRGDRNVTLEGAAFFEVKHDEAHPFTVHAAGAEIRDIGTSFSVKTDGVGGVSVSVTHGIVAVREATASREAVELHAGDRGVVGAGAVSVTRGTVTEEEVSWTRGQLSYRDASLAEVQADLKRWYGINLQIADSALLRLTVTMPAQSDSARILSNLVALLGAESEQHGDTVILRSAGRSTTP